MGGEDKGLQQYRNRRLIEHAIDRISPQVDEIIISANRNLAEYRKLGFAVVSDNDMFEGPLAGIASAIPFCKHPWVLVVPCDMPALPDDLVATMAKHAERAPLVAIRSHGKLQLIFLMHRSLVDSINEQLANNQRTVMRWLDTTDAFIVAMDNENYFYNVNSPEKLEH